MRATARLGAMQARAVSRMADTCLVTSPGTRSASPDPTTLQYVDGPPVTVYTGACRLGRVDIPNIAQAVGGEATWDVQDSVLHLPLTGTDSVAEGQTVTYLTSTRNPALVGKVFGIVGVVGGTDLTARRCLVREVVSV